MADDDTEPKIFSQRQFNEQVARSMTKWRKDLRDKAQNLERENAELKKQLEQGRALGESSASVSASINPPSDPTPEPVSAEVVTVPETTPTVQDSEPTPRMYDHGPTNDEPDDPYLQELDQIANGPDPTEQLRAEFEEKLSRERSERRAAERDLILERALVSAACCNVALGKRLFVSEMTYDVASDKWAIGGKDPSEAIAAELPDELRKPTIQRGGSGMTTGQPRGMGIRAEIAAQQKKVEQLAAQARKQNNTNVRLEYAREKNKLSQMKGQR